VAKLYLFQAAVGAQLYGLAIVGVLTSVLGAYYYLRVIVYMYMRPADGEAETLSTTGMAVALGAAVAVVVLLGIVAEPVARLAQVASAILL
jgi:NADH-quinone oxidoreductase subunit N